MTCINVNVATTFAHFWPCHHVCLGRLMVPCDCATQVFTNGTICGPDRWSFTGFESRVDSGRRFKCQTTLANVNYVTVQRQVEFYSDWLYINEVQVVRSGAGPGMLPATQARCAQTLPGMLFNTIGVPHCRFSIMHTHASHDPECRAPSWGWVVLL